MAKADDIVNLIKTHNDGDDKGFDACVAAIVANNKAAGTVQGRNLAERIERLLRNGKGRWLTLSSQDAFYLKDVLESGLAWAEESNVKLSDMVLSDNLSLVLKKVVQERAATDKLRAHGLEPVRKILCYGPPGTGKTMSASALAGELNLPLYIVSAEKTIGQYLGSTAQNLGKIFNVIKRAEGVWFFDEFDSLARERTAGTGGGDSEMSRVMGSLLQFIERDKSSSIIMAATNMPKLLDKALYRRFDVVASYTLPTLREISPLITGAAASAGLENVLDIMPPEVELRTKIAHLMAGYNHATVVRACRDAAKTLILEDKPVCWGTFLPELENAIRLSGAANDFRNAGVGYGD